MTTDESANTAAETDCGDDLEDLLEAQNNLEETLAGLVTSIDAYVEALNASMKQIEQNLDELLLASVRDFPTTVN